MHWTIKLIHALPENGKCLCRSFRTTQGSLLLLFSVFSNTLGQVSESVAYNLHHTSCIEIYKAHCWLTIGSLISCTFSSHWILSLTKTGWITVLVFKLRSFSCSQTKSVESWYWKGRTIWIIGFSFGAGCLLLKTIVKWTLVWIYNPVLDYVLQGWKAWL